MDTAYNATPRSAIGWSSSLLAHGLLVGAGFLIARELPPPWASHTPYRLELRLTEPDAAAAPAPSEVRPHTPTTSLSTRVASTAAVPRAVERAQPPAHPPAFPLASPAVTQRGAPQPTRLEQAEGVRPVERSPVTKAPVSQEIRPRTTTPPSAEPAIAPIPRIEQRQVINVPEPTELQSVSEVTQPSAPVQTIEPRARALTTADAPVNTSERSHSIVASQIEQPVPVQTAAAPPQPLRTADAPSESHDQSSSPVASYAGGSPSQDDAHDTPIETAVEGFSSAAATSDSSLDAPNPDHAMTDPGSSSSSADTTAPPTVAQATEAPAAPDVPQAEPARSTNETPVVTARVHPPIDRTLTGSPDYRWLMESLRHRVESLKAYPRLARLQGWEGRVVVRATIGSDGRLVEAKVTESSGHLVLDEDALRLMHRSCPIRLAQELGDSQVVVFIPVFYRLHQP